MSTTRTMRKGDLLPALEVRLTYSEGDLSSAIPMGTPVVFTMAKKGTPSPVATTPKVNRRPADVVSSANGVVVVRYSWALGDTDIPGTYQAEFVFTVGGLKLTAPSSGYLTVKVEEDLD